MNMIPIQFNKPPTSREGVGRMLGRLDVFPTRLVCSLVALLTATAAGAQTNGVPGPQDYASFSHFINDRNIFDPNRVPHSYNPRTSHRLNRPRPSSRQSGIQLVGTMSYDKGWFAFFGGNSADLSKVLPAGGKIADYTITEITPDTVRVESTDKKEPASLKVGDGFRQENGKWVLAKAGELPAASSAPETAAASSTESADPAPAAPDPAGEPNEVLKRLMQQREKENQ